MSTISRRILECLTEEDNLSLTRVIAITGWFSFLIVSFYLMIKHQSWEHYDAFCLFAASGSAATQISNKLINSKYNSVNGGTDQIKVTINKDNKSITSLNS